MKIISLDVCHSTQEELKNQVSDSFNKIIIHTKNQTNGIGQRGRSWFHFEGSLALSLTFRPCNSPTLTPLKIGILLCKYFDDLDLKLKWPNDLILNGKKVGGIICEYINNDLVLVGIGINIFETESKEFEFPHGFINRDIEIRALVDFLYSTEVKNIQSDFMKVCDHLNKDVFLDSDLVRFEGIGNDGEALVKIGESEKKYYSARLRYS